MPYLELKVTPKITPANTVNLHVFVTKNQKSAQTGAGGEPGIDIREVETDLLVENGKTVVIGGIYETYKEQNRKQGSVFWQPSFLRLFFQKHQGGGPADRNFSFFNGKYCVISRKLPVKQMARCNDIV